MISFYASDLFRLPSKIRFREEITEELLEMLLGAT
jgi:hypothetical protein